MGYMGMQMRALTDKGRKAAGCNSWQHVVLHPKVEGHALGPTQAKDNSAKCWAGAGPNKKEPGLGQVVVSRPSHSAIPGSPSPPLDFLLKVGSLMQRISCLAQSKTSKPTPTTYCLHHSQITSTMRWASTYTYGAQLPQHQHTAVQ